MEKLITSTSALELDAISQDKFLLPSLSLMENASLQLFQHIEKCFAEYHHVLFIAGCGNNGGDAIAAARIAWCRGYRNISIYYASGKESDQRRVQREAAIALGIPSSSEIAGDCVVDGLYGAGLKGSVRKEGKELIERINSLKAFVIAVDVPSGISDTGDAAALVRADITVTMGYSKLSMYIPPRRALCGKIALVNPSFAPVCVEPAAYLLSESDYSVPQLSSCAYKNSRGHVAIFGGCERYTGAVRLASRAAFKAGAGLVTVFTDPAIRDLVAADNLSAMVRTYDDAVDMSKFSAILIGPGMGKGREALLERIITSYDGPVIIDADGITSFASLWNKDMKIISSLIFTPHPGELERLGAALLSDRDSSSPSGYISMLDSLSALTGNSIIIAKSDVNVIVKHGDIPLVYDGSNPALGVAGSGDVLAGITAAFASAGIDVSNAVVLHQKAGRRAAVEKHFFTSEELLDYVGEER